MAKKKLKLAPGQVFAHESGRLATCVALNPDDQTATFDVQRHVLDKSTGELNTDTRQRVVPAELLRVFLRSYHLER